VCAAGGEFGCLQHGRPFLQPGGAARSAWGCATCAVASSRARAARRSALRRSLSQIRRALRLR